MQQLADIVGFGAAAGDNLVWLLLSPASHFSLWSLLAAFGLALGVLLARRKRPLPLRVAVRALLPRDMLRGRSARTDLRFLILNGALGPILFGWAIFSYHQIGVATAQGLELALGVMPASALPQLAIALVMSVALFVAYELGYWLDHWLSHHVPFLWEFHKVHHTAETLSPVTNFRVHPVDTLLFYNVVALITGMVNGLLLWSFGGAAAPLTVEGVNVLMVAFVFLLLHLQHSQLWITLPGRIGSAFLSPAHHQLHHSRDPAHFNSNYGNALSLFDRLFGTLRRPPVSRLRLRFGVAGLPYDGQTLHGALLMPFTDAMRSTRRR